MTTPAKSPAPGLFSEHNVPRPVGTPLKRTDTFVANHDPFWVQESILEYLGVRIE